MQNSIRTYFCLCFIILSLLFVFFSSVSPCNSATILQPRPSIDLGNGANTTSCAVGKPFCARSVRVILWCTSSKSRETRICGCHFLQIKPFLKEMHGRVSVLRKKGRHFVHPIELKSRNITDTNWTALIKYTFLQNSLQNAQNFKLVTLFLPSFLTDIFQKKFKNIEKDFLII